MITGLRALAGAMAMLVTLSPAIGGGPASPLKGLEPGEWELRERAPDDGSPDVRRLCLADIRQLIHIRHPRSQCKRLTVDEAANRLSVSYDCGSAGSGRTDLRVETPKLLQLRVQGITDGAPFSLAMEGRRLGACR